MAAARKKDGFRRAEKKTDKDPTKNDSTRCRPAGKQAEKVCPSQSLPIAIPPTTNILPAPSTTSYISQDLETPKSDTETPTRPGHVMKIRKIFQAQTLLQNPKQETQDPKQETSMCAGCTMTCCNLRIDLTTYDMYRINGKTGKSFDEFTVLIQAFPEDAYAIKTKEGLVKFILDRKEDGLCVFFDHGNDLHCSIEEDKPSICLEYPFNLEDGVPRLRNDIVCPKANLERADRTKMSKKNMADCKWEMERYLEFVGDWNERAKGEEDPQEFIMFAMREMERESRFISSIIRHIKRRVRKHLQTNNTKTK